MKNLVGSKIRGFYFKDKSFLSYSSEMDDFIGEVGEIVNQNSSEVTIEFGTDVFSYPLPEALDYVLKEDKPIIPELEGVEMELTEDGETWTKKHVLGTHKGRYITYSGSYYHSYGFARPISVKKVTMEELEKLVGGKFEIVK